MGGYGAGAERIVPENFDLAAELEGGYRGWKTPRRLLWRTRDGRRRMWQSGGDQQRCGGRAVKGQCVVMLAGLQLFASAERARGPAVEPRRHGRVGAQRRARRRWPCMAAPKDGADMKRSALGTCTGISHLAGVRHVRLCVLDLTSKNLRENEPARQVCRTNGAGSPAACSVRVASSRLPPSRL